MMPTSLSNIFIHSNSGRFLVFGSGVVGFSCFALSPSYQHLFGHWNWGKIVLYCTASFMFSVMILFVKHSRQRFPGVLRLKTLVVCSVLMLITSLYSYYEDRSKQGETAEKGYKRKLSLISFGAFAFLSMSLSTLIQPGFEVGMTNFFLGCLIVAAMKMSFKMGLGVRGLCSVVLSSIRSHSESGRGGDTRDANAIIEIASLFRNETQRLAHEARNGDQEMDDSSIDTADSFHEETSAIRSPLTLNIHLSHSTLRRRSANLNGPLLLVSLTEEGQAPSKWIKMNQFLPRVSRVTPLSLGIWPNPKALQYLGMFSILYSLDLTAPNLNLPESWASILANLPCRRLLKGPRGIILYFPNPTFYIYDCGHGGFASSAHVD